MLPTSAIDALGDQAIVFETRVGKTFKIVFRGGGPALDQMITVRFVIKEELDDIGTVQLALKVDEGIILKTFLLLFLHTVS